MSHVEAHLDVALHLGQARVPHEAHSTADALRELLRTRGHVAEQQPARAWQKVEGLEARGFGLGARG